MKLASSLQFQSVQEWDDRFLALWTHRYDYLWAEHPNPGDRPEWKTESRYPLSDRLIQQGTYLYGVRFGPTTRYILLDIDKGSIYHPSRDRFAWKRMVAALESLGLTQPIICTSSYSGGLHLYFPFEDEQKTWAIALVITTLLENAGFKLVPGQLEVFPNCKAYAVDGEHSLYNGHRLPMQAGSYLLNPDLQPMWGDQQTFVQQWQLAQAQNSVDEKTIERILKAARRRQFRITGKAEKFLNDLNAEIEQGWTGHGQTNRLLGRITMRSYIFGHVCNSSTPLAGKALIDDIVETAQSLPGYADWCNHQHEIEERAQEWASCVEASHYFPYGKNKPSVESNSDNQEDEKSHWNQQQQTGARERIQQAIADLLEKEALPTGITERFDALVSYRISGSTLYRHQDLWHPRYLQAEINCDLQTGMEQDCLIEASCSNNPPNLLVENGCNTLLDKEFSSTEIESGEGQGCNTLPGEDSIDSAPGIMTQAEGIAYIKQVLKQIQTRRQTEKFQKDELKWQRSTSFVGENNSVNLSKLLAAELKPDLEQEL